MLFKGVTPETEEDEAGHFSLGFRYEAVSKKAHLLKAWCNNRGSLRGNWIVRLLTSSLDETSDELTIEWVTRRLGLVRSRVLLPGVYLDWVLYP